MICVLKVHSTAMIVDLKELKKKLVAFEIYN
jgi:hypothetical protein